MSRDLCWVEFESHFYYRDIEEEGIACIEGGTSNYSQFEWARKM